eukprot:TRINITY_DN2210_c0_g1_i1.p1 TRINITY_DN2210_c0_g1~~TRINITY_DN2210_c0_g1_i1.p1  ORF type:complete len:150 (+),score=30.43 TRINITY_DN2210_c0_g1_i1:28-477(+)
MKLIFVFFLLFVFLARSQTVINIYNGKSCNSVNTTLLVQDTINAIINTYNSGNIQDIPNYLDTKISFFPASGIVLSNANQVIQYYQSAYANGVHLEVNNISDITQAGDYIFSTFVLTVTTPLPSTVSSNSVAIGRIVGNKLLLSTFIGN